MTNKWVSALHDDEAGVSAVQSCVGLGDLHGDGDTKLVIADFGTSRFLLLSNKTTKRTDSTSSSRSSKE